MKRFVLKGLVPVMLVAGLIACSNQEDGKKDVSTNTKASATAENNDTGKKEENSSVVETPENSLEKDGNKETESPKTELDMANMKKVGTKEYGYVNVPKEWVNFKDLNPNTSFQVSSKDGSQIISLNIFKDAGKDADVETYANIVATNMETQGAKDLRGAKVSLGKYQTLQVYGAYKEGKYFVVAWIFKAEDGKYHYISAEGGIDRITDVVSYIEKGGWSLN